MTSRLKNKMLIAALVPAIGLPLTSASFAQSESAAQARQSEQSSQSAQARQGQRQQQNIRDMRATELVGATVRNKQGQELGEVQDLIVDAGQERVEYAILAFGGFMGFGEKLFAYPMDRFQARGSGDSKELVLNVNEEELKNAPGFDRSNWPSFGMGGYRGEVDKHFGKTAKTGGDLLRMSEMLGEDVSDRAGNDVGEIEDVVVSVNSGRVRFVALQPDDDLNMENRIVMLPMQAIEATSAQQASGSSGRSDGASSSDGEQAVQAQAARDEAAQQQSQQMSADAQREQASGASAVTGASSGKEAAPSAERMRNDSASRQSSQSQQSRQQAQQEGELKLVLNLEPKQLQNARSFQDGQWPELNSRSFQRDIERYVASFPSGRTTSTGSSGSDGAASSGAGDKGATGNN